ncbi:MAG: DUF2905 domain-containing protein [Myxococcota bacterium]
MADLGKMLLVLGAVLAATGGVLLLVGKLGGLPALPGDIVVKRDNFTFAFPLGWSILISVVGSVVLTLVLRLLARSQG